MRRMVTTDIDLNDQSQRFQSTLHDTAILGF